MRIKGLVSAAGPDVTLSPGVECDVPDDVGEELIKAGHAESVKAKAKPKKAAKPEDGDDEGEGE